MSQGQFLTRLTAPLTGAGGLPTDLLNALNFAVYVAGQMDVVVTLCPPRPAADVPYALTDQLVSECNSRIVTASAEGMGRAYRERGSTGLADVSNELTLVADPMTCYGAPNAHRAVWDAGAR